MRATRRYPSIIPLRWRIAKAAAVTASLVVLAAATATLAAGKPMLSAESYYGRIAAVAGVSLAGAILALYVAARTIRWVCIARAPLVDADPATLAAALAAEPAEKDGRRTFGRSWLAESHGIRRLYLEGDPFEIGLANAKLTGDLIIEIEESLLRTLRQYVPSYAARWLIGQIVLLRNRTLPRHVPEEYKTEVLGLSRGFEDRHAEIAPLYHRMLNYHAAHDIGHAFENTSLATTSAVEDSSVTIRRAAGGDSLAGCTGFAAWGRHVRDGHVLVGRNCDLEAGPTFDVNKIVTLFRPREGNAFLSVSWAGWLGAVTGLNEKRLFVSINASHADDGRRIGTPVSFVVRRALQYASGITEAVEIIERAEMFVSEAFLVADGNAGRAVIVEKSPHRTAVRESEGEYLVSANHFLTDTFAGDRANRDFMASATTVARHERMDELVARAKGELDATGAAEVLRDRRGMGDLDVGNGNRSTVNPLIATHSVIADATAGTLWVAAAPHQLGAYVPFSIESFDTVDADGILPADEFLTGGGYGRYLESEDLLARGDALLRAGDPAGAKRLLNESSALNPSYYRGMVLLARVALAENDRAEAKRLLERALERQPPFRRHREMIRRLLARAGPA